jgi:hypothetical protein
MKSRDEIHVAISRARVLNGFAHSESGDDAADRVMACCTGVDADTVAACEAFAVGADVGAVPFMLIIQLAMQLIPIIFGEGGFTVEKLTAILSLIQSIFA